MSGILPLIPRWLVGFLAGVVACVLGVVGNILVRLSYILNAVYLRKKDDSIRILSISSKYSSIKTFDPEGMASSSSKTPLLEENQNDDLCSRDCCLCLLGVMDTQHGNGDTNWVLNDSSRITHYGEFAKFAKNTLEHPSPELRRICSTAAEFQMLHFSKLPQFLKKRASSLNASTLWYAGIATGSFLATGFHAVGIALAPIILMASSTPVSIILNIFVAWLLLGETPLIIQILGSVFATAGVVLLIFSSGRSSASLSQMNKWFTERLAIIFLCTFSFFTALSVFTSIILVIKNKPKHNGSKRILFNETGKNSSGVISLGQHDRELSPALTNRLSCPASIHSSEILRTKSKERTCTCTAEPVMVNSLGIQELISTEKEENLVAMSTATDKEGICSTLDLRLILFPVTSGLCGGATAIAGKMSITSAIAILTRISDWLCGNSESIIKESVSPIIFGLLSTAFLILFGSGDLYFMTKSLKISTSAFVFPAKCSVSFIINTLGGLTLFHEWPIRMGYFLLGLGLCIVGFSLLLLGVFFVYRGCDGTNRVQMKVPNRE